MILATDYDGTLFFHRQEEPFHPGDFESARRFQEDGNLFVLNTGRPHFLWEQMENDLDGRVRFDYRIFSNGSLILNEEGRVLYEKLLPEETVRKVLTRWPDMEFFWHISPESAYLGTDQKEMVKGLNSATPYRVHGFSFRLDDERKREALKELEKNPDIIAYHNEHFVDIVRRDASKADGMKQVRILSGAPHALAAIGDSDNDLPAILEADYGFTFPWADESIREQADYVVGSIAEAIEILEGRSLNRGKESV